MSRSSRFFCFFAGIAALFALGGCGSSEDPTEPVTAADTTHLRATFGVEGSVTFTWEATGHGQNGQVASYDFRYTSYAPNLPPWSDWTPADGEPEPHAAGHAETFTVAGLAAGDTLAFRLEVVDGDGNRLAESNTAIAVSTRFRTWYIKADRAGDAPTIRAACIDSAADGDVVLVAAGRYTWTNQGDFNPDFGMIYFHRDNPGVWLRSESGPASTILDAEGWGRVIHVTGLSQDYPKQMTIEGFTITGGNGNVAEVTGLGSGGGMQAHLCSPTIRNCIFRGNIAAFGGGLWYGGTGQPRIENCVFEDNRANSTEAGLGGGLCLLNDRLATTVIDCVFRNNTAAQSGGGLFVYNFKVQIENCLFDGNDAIRLGGGLVFDSIDAEHTGMVTGCTVVGNTAASGGSALRVTDGFDYVSNLTVRNTIFAFNTGSVPLSLYNTPVVAMSCCDIFGNEQGDTLPGIVVDEGGNFSADPLFCGTEADQAYGLSASSPCAPGQHPDGIGCGLIGARSVGCGP